MNAHYLQSLDSEMNQLYCVPAAILARDIQIEIQEGNQPPEPIAKLAGTWHIKKNCSKHKQVINQFDSLQAKNTRATCLKI